MRKSEVPTHANDEKANLKQYSKTLDIELYTIHYLPLNLLR
jgi:hypothetical protein